MDASATTLEQAPEKKPSSQCQYQGCHERCQDAHELCFWHDPETDKRGDDIVTRLQHLAFKGYSLRGFQLQHANLKGLRLTPENPGQRVDLSFANLHRADLRGAHLYRVKLHRANLLKADASGANLNYADLSGANLLGTRLDRCRMERVQWGRFFHQELLVREKNSDTHQSDKELYGEAEEICRNVRQSYEACGLTSNAGYFFHREMGLRRKQMPLWSWRRSLSKLVDVLCGYGERPRRIVTFSLTQVLICALFYFFFGIIDGDGLIQFQADAQLMTNIGNLLNTLYFSVVTFTTLGYGDLIPVGLSRAVAAIQAFSGTFTLALFVIVFSKKMTR